MSNDIGGIAGDEHELRLAALLSVMVLTIWYQKKI